MTSEAQLVQDLEDRHLELTVADGTGISKGQLLQLTDPSTASANSAATQNFAGILLVDKEANDGQTRVSVSNKAIWDIYVDPYTTVADGDFVSFTSANHIEPCDIAASGAKAVVGKALQDGAACERIEVLVGAL